MRLATLIHTALRFSAAAAIVGCGGSTASNGGSPYGNGTPSYDATAPGEDGGGNDGSVGYSSSGNNVGPGTTSGGPSPSSGGSPMPSSSGGSSSSGGGGGGTMCVPSCASNSDCQNSCPPVAGGINCCDLMSGMCFPSQMAACPSSGVGAAE